MERQYQENCYRSAEYAEADSGFRGSNDSAFCTLGMLAAVKQGKITDMFIRFLSFIGNSIPNFIVSLLFLYFLALKLAGFLFYQRVHGTVSCFLHWLWLCL